MSDVLHTVAPGEARIVPRDVVLAELDRVTRSAAFATVERPGRFLRHLVETTLKGDGHLLKETLIGVEVFDRPPDWNPRIDPIVRQEAARLRKRLARHYESHGAGSGIRIELPVGGYVPVFRTVATPQADMPNAGPAKPSGPAHRRVWWIASISALFCAALVTFLLVRAHEQRDRRRPASPEAEELCLRGVYYWQKRTPASLNQAVDLFTQAIVRDPKYAPAYVGLAKCYNLLREFAAMPEAEAYPRALAATEKALELDDSLADAHTSLAFIAFWWKWNAALADREYRRAIELDPNSALAHHWYATFLHTRGRSAEALKQIERAQELEPTSTSILADKGLILYSEHRRDDAVKLLGQLETADPAQQSSYRYLAEIYLAEGRYPEALEQLKQYADRSANPSAQRVAAAASRGFAAGGSKGMLQSMLAAQVALHQHQLVPSYALAQTCALLDRKKEALAYLDAASTEPGSAFLAYRVDVLLMNLHPEPEFQNLDTRFEPLIRDCRWPGHS